MKRVISYILILLLYTFAANALENRYVFKKLNNKDGLSHNTVRDIVQEESGILWIATKQGLNKYDSYKIKSYYREDHVGIPSNFITELLVTKSNCLFVGTQRGLVEYNRQFDNFSPVLFDGEDLPSVLTIVETKDGTLLIGTRFGIYSYHPGQNTVQLLSTQNEINSITENDDGTLLVTSLCGVFLLSANGELLEIYDKVNNKGLTTNIIKKAFVDTKGNCWIGTTNGGLFLFNRKEKEFKNIRLAVNDLPEAKKVCDINQDPEGNIWICTELGLFIYDPIMQQCRNIQQSLENSAYNLNDNDTYCLFRSKEDIMWIGTYLGGLNYTHLQNSKGIYNIFPGVGKDELPGKAIYNLYKDSKGILWIAFKDGGICTMNLKTKEVLKYYFYGIKNSLSRNSVHTITEDRDGKLWFGHYQTGIDVLNPSTGKFYQLPILSEIKDSIDENSVYSIFKDSKEQMWVGTRKGAYRYNYEKQRLEPFLPEELGDAFIYKISEDKNGKIWFCIRVGKGVVNYNEHTKELKRYSVEDGLSSTQITTFTEDSSGKIWIGTNGGGVNVFNPETDSIQHLNMNDGLANNTIKGVLEADDGNIWLSTNQGISMYNVQSKTFRNYDLDDGLAQMQFRYGAYFKDDDGTLYFGHINGLTCINPADVSINTNKPYLVFTDFKLGNQSIQPADDGVLTASIDQTDNIVLNYSQNAFTIDFAAVNHVTNGENKFYYYLDGFEDDWMEVGNKTSATYTSLKPGEYIFYLKAEDKDGIESYNVKRLEIKIPVPFYLSKWAYLIYLFVFLLLIYFLNRYASSYLNREKAALERERLEKEKTETLNQLKKLWKIEAKHTKSELQDVDIVSYLRGTSIVFSPLFAQNHINFEFSASHKEYSYWFDPNKTEKIVANLIISAVKNTPSQGKIVCEVNIEEEKANGKQKQITISVSNSGKQISEEELRSLFVSHSEQYQADQQENNHESGLTGLKSLVEDLSGTVNVIDESIETTKIEISLPLVDAEKPGIKKENEIAKEFNLLIVSDNLDLAKYLQQRYSCNFNVKYVKNGLEALGIVKEEEPDIIISDVVLPEIDGIEFCKKIKQDETNSHIAFVLFSTNNTYHDKIAGLEAGAEAYVRIPFDLNELDLDIRNFIEVRKKLKEKIASGVNIDFDKLNFRNNDKEFLEKVSAIINENIKSETFNTEELALQLGVSKTIVYLKLKKLLDMSGSDYIRLLRFKKAIELMADSSRNISDIAFEVGFSDPNYFGKAFKKVYKKSPMAFRKELLANAKGVIVS